MNDQRFDRIRALAALVLVGLMALAAEISGENGLIFPSLAALLLGGWVAKKQPWNAGRLQTWLLLAAAALGGSCIVRYLPGGISVQTAVGLLFAGVLLAVSRSSMIFVFSTCLLPILLGMKTLLYPAAVCVFVGIFALGQLLFERFGLREPAECSVGLPLAKGFLHWGKVVLFLIILCEFPVRSNLIALVAPPLLVTFAAFSSPESEIRTQPGKVWLLLLAGGVWGTICQVLHISLQVSSTVTAILAFLGVLLLFSKTKLSYPPAGAAALLPLLLPAETIFQYPVLLAMGAAAMVWIPYYLFVRRPVRPRPMG